MKMKMKDRSIDMTQVDLGLNTDTIIVNIKNVSVW